MRRRLEESEQGRLAVTESDGRLQVLLGQGDLQPELPDQAAEPRDGDVTVPVIIDAVAAV